MANEARKIMVTIRRAPYGSIYVQEALEVLFIVASYGMDLSVVFIDDGVLALKSGQDAKDLGMRGFAASIGALTDFEVSKVYVDKQSLLDRNIDESELMDIGEDEETEELLSPQVIDSDAITAMFAEQHSIISF
ncbi:MAG: sulfurtransferase TusC [Gammaproteobacteria bacterium]|nr:sulfurtransferase TusC [Gammaproteobacteria bacterium]